MKRDEIIDLLDDISLLYWDNQDSEFFADKIISWHNSEMRRVLNQIKINIGVYNKIDVVNLIDKELEGVK